MRISELIIIFNDIKKDAMGLREPLRHYRRLAYVKMANVNKRHEGETGWGYGVGVMDG